MKLTIHILFIVIIILISVSSFCAYQAGEALLGKLYVMSQKNV